MASTGSRSSWETTTRSSARQASPTRELPTKPLRRRMQTTAMLRSRPSPRATRNGTSTAPRISGLSRRLSRVRIPTLKSLPCFPDPCVSVRERMEAVQDDAATGGADGMVGEREPAFRRGCSRLDSHLLLCLLVRERLTAQASKC
jgi:hypothetical protein